MSSNCKTNQLFKKFPKQKAYNIKISRTIIKRLHFERLIFPPFSRFSPHPVRPSRRSIRFRFSRDPSRPRRLERRAWTGASAKLRPISNVERIPRTDSWPPLTSIIFTCSLTFPVYLNQNLSSGGTSRCKKRVTIHSEPLVVFSCSIFEYSVGMPTESFVLMIEAVFVRVV